ncbi:MutS-related protein [Carboxylicivirga taeanensis]|uniref:MutS-related protein n=1 Tax=Carboxylicivirga taeanensis TaxID=1416875 RepID=UPI003F6E025A
MGATNGRQPIEDRSQSYISSRNEWQKKETRLSHNFVVNAWLRLLFFVAAFAVPFLLCEPWTTSFFIVFALSFGAFLGLVWRANRISYERMYVAFRLQLLNKEIKALGHEWVDEADGADLIEMEHDYAHDLDLFGKGSLFQFINRTATKGGYLSLGKKLKTVLLNASQIRARQTAIKELASLNDFRQHYYALAAIVEKGNKRNRQLDVSKQPDLSFITGWTKYLIAVFFLLLGASVLLVAIGVWSANVIMWLFFLGLMLAGIHLKKINRVHNEVSSLGNYLHRYARLIKHVEQTDMQSPYLVELKQGLEVDGQTASEVMQRLASHIKLFDQRLNMLSGVLLNGFLLWDLIVCFRLQGWYQKYGDQLVRWMETLDELEALNSLATFTYNHPNYVLPRLSTDVIFTATELGHPLISAEERVCNNFDFSEQQRICVITGANMAGKSTFLRTVGVALVLAGNGCVVPARELEYKPLPFITNMRAVDNLLKHESYFFAELSRLQMIVERLKEHGELFFILDEILKGTNSLDKYQGSVALIKQLLKYNGCGLVATHDLELGQLSEETQGRVFNNCFEVNFDNEGLSFDYKLRTGVTQSHNATYLMEKMGLIPSENVRF